MVYFPTREEWGLLFYKGPLAIIITRKNLTRAKKIHEMKRWFVNEFGIYERDVETEYRSGKQLISIYNSHGETLEKKAVQKIEKLYVTGKDTDLINYLYELYPKIKEKIEKNNADTKNKAIKAETIYDLLHEIAIETKHEAIDIDTDKYLYTLRAYNPKAIKQLADAARDGKHEIETLSPTLPKGVMPIIYIFAIVMIIAILAQNIPAWIREALEYLENKGFLFILDLFK